jgi:hypothetical protein
MVSNKRGVRPRKPVRRRQFSPREPEIVAGRFAGRKLSALADGDLECFVRVDARFQTKPVATLEGALLSCPDLSQYWFAKYELERRKPDAQRQPPAALEIRLAQTPESVALTLIQYGYRAASRKYHPDHGGDTGIMQLLNAARDLARGRLAVRR